MVKDFRFKVGASATARLLRSDVPNLLGIKEGQTLVVYRSGVQKAQGNDDSSGNRTYHAEPYAEIVVFDNPEMGKKAAEFIGRMFDKNIVGDLFNEEFNGSQGWVKLLTAQIPNLKRVNEHTAFLVTEEWRELGSMVDDESNPNDLPWPKTFRFDNGATTFATCDSDGINKGNMLVVWKSFYKQQRVGDWIGEAKAHLLVFDDAEMGKQVGKLVALMRTMTTSAQAKVSDFPMDVIQAMDNASDEVKRVSTANVHKITSSWRELGSAPPDVPDAYPPELEDDAILPKKRRIS